LPLFAFFFLFFSFFSTFFFFFSHLFCLFCFVSFFFRFFSPRQYAPVRGGDHFKCLLRHGRLFCFGLGNNGRLGRPDGSTLHRGETVGDMATVVAVDLGLGAGESVVEAASGEGHTCALTTLGRVKCFGYGAQGQLGVGDWGWGCVVFIFVVVFVVVFRC
jgi:hypothetical protein